MPPGDPHEALRLQQSPELALDRINLRVDWQTLRRLPLSGAIIFNFKALFTPITEFRDEAYIPALCLKVLKEGKENMMRYKNTCHVEHVTIPALELWAEEQVKEGKVEKDWKVETLEQSPWFPGWEQKWRDRQGFGRNESYDGGRGGGRLPPKWYKPGNEWFIEETWMTTESVVALSVEFSLFMAGGICGGPLLSISNCDDFLLLSQWASCKNTLEIYKWDFLPGTCGRLEWRWRAGEDEEGELGWEVGKQ